jgi:HAD superfamily hydrolase (TIGR01549 family)
MSIQRLLTGKKALLLDMNGTFMFEHDRFSTESNYHEYYRLIGGTLGREQINRTIEAAYNYLDYRYTRKEYIRRFPTVEHAVRATERQTLDEKELARIVETFSYHEMGQIYQEYAEGLKSLAQRFTLGLVSDIWSPKQPWQRLFDKMGLTTLFSGWSFSSDHGMIKPAAEPFEMVLDQLGFKKHQVLVIGDSVQRDLGGAQAAGIDCMLVGGASHENAVLCRPSLLNLLSDA